MQKNLDHIVLQTAIPGPLSRQALSEQQRLESGAVSYPRRLPVAIARARGSYIEDLDGNVFLDFLTGAGSLPLGHCHPDVVQAAQQQMGQFCHGLDFPSKAKERFTAGMLNCLPADMRQQYKVHYCAPTGADAIEAAIKLCKLYTKADEIISFQGGYHGCTTGAMSVTGLRSVKQHIGNRMPGVHFFPFSNCTACPLGLARTSCAINCIEMLEHALDDPNSGIGRPAAVILEMVQGEGGVVPAQIEFAKRLRALTLRHQIPMIVDEIQTGCGRTGTWCAFEQYGIEPDVIVMSKGLSGLGLPVSLMFYRQSMDVWTAGAHIGTFRGNQVAFAAGVAALEIFEQDQVLANVRAQGAKLKTGLEQLAAQYPVMRHVRGLGLMLGFDAVHPDTGQPDSTMASLIQEGALQRGLILELGGRNDTVVRMLPALNITSACIQTALRVLDQTLMHAASQWTEKTELKQSEYSI
jgi:diaminobutyrate-2-oxoglutarate transaminase